MVRSPDREVVRSGRSASQKGQALAALHETMSDLHKVGAVDDATMREFDERCLMGQDQSIIKSAPALSFQVYRDAKGEWRWRLVAANGKRIAGSGEGYKTKAACMAAIELVK